MTNDDTTLTGSLHSTMLGLRMVIGLTLGAAVMAAGSVWTIGAMALTRRSAGALSTPIST